MVYEIITDNTVAIIGCLCITLIIIDACRTKRPQNIPPGPRGLPVIGNLAELSGNRVKATKQLRWKYGNVYSLYMGRSLAVFVHGYKNLKEVLCTRGDEFADRPEGFFIRLGRGTGVSLSSGQTWKEQREFAFHNHREVGFRRSNFEGIIQEEVEVLLKCIEDKCGKPFKIGTLMQTTAANVIASIVFGQRFDHDDPKFQTFLGHMDQFSNSVSLSSVVSFLPWLRYIPGDIFKYHRYMESLEGIANFTKEGIQCHKETFDPNDLRDFIDAYLLKITECQSIEEQSSFHEDQLESVLGDFFVAGTESTMITISWAFMYMVRYPNIQNKVRDELYSVTGNHRLPSITDRQNLPYTEATLMEIQRHADIAPLSVPRAATVDTHIAGYSIPKGTLIMPVISSALNDPEIWTEPDVFNPDRFLDPKGTLRKPEEFIPFSNGRRICPGASLAKMELFLVLTAIIQGFTLRRPEGAPPPLLEGISGFLRTPRPYELCAILNI